MKTDFIIHKIIFALVFWITVFLETILMGSSTGNLIVSPKELKLLCQVVKTFFGVEFYYQGQIALLKWCVLITVIFFCKCNVSPTQSTMAVDDLPPKEPGHQASQQTEYVINT